MICLPNFFSDGMVIRPTTRIWGRALPEQQVEIQFLDRVYEVMSGADGKFEVVVTGTIGGPYTMHIGDRMIKDIYVGRLWLCGGQSNMETPLSRVSALLHAHIQEDNRIKVFQVEKGLCFDAPAKSVNGMWCNASGEFLNHLFAVPYFFARALLENDPTPIGLINVAAGGTPIEGWLPEEIIKTFPTHYERLVEVNTSGFVENLTCESDSRIQKWYETLISNDKGLAEDWFNTDYDDSGWNSRMLLDNSGFDHGVVWLRKKIFLESSEGVFALNFGRVVDSVKVYINGELVITVDYQYPPCICTIPAGIIKTGENLIAVRVVGESQPLKFIPGKAYELISAGIRVDLSGEWKWQIGCRMPRMEPRPWFYNYPCGVYNFMLAPVLDMPVDGVIWYQGESNTSNPHEYSQLFTHFINHVRTRQVAELPIIYTQLANFIDPSETDGENWAILREQQRTCLNLPNTAMAVAIDCGEWNDLHPMDKKTIGERLALCVRRLVYKESVVSDGPKAIKAKSRQGRLTVYFEYGQGLWAKGGHPLLDVVDMDGFVHRVFAKIEDNTLVAQIGSVNVSSVRFNWNDCPAVVVYNAYNLPASPFHIKVNTSNLKVVHPALVILP